jgi:peptidoglycan/LPS O-acetylase OafA/YrhL
MSTPRLSTSDSSVLDFLRATAVSLVLLDHIVEIGGSSSFTWLAQRLGWMGVMLFFVHTSLVLMFSLERTKAAGPSLLKHFYVRRAFRIYPLAVVVILLIVLFQLPVATHTWHLETMSRSVVLGNLLLVQNLFYIPPVLGPLWSLPLEVQMYVVLPFLFWIVGRGTNLGSAVSLVVLFIGLAVLQPYVTGRANVLQYAPCFMGGIVAFCLTKRRAAVWPFWTWGVALAGGMLGYIALATLQSGVESMALSWALGLFVGSLVPNFSETKSGILRRLSAIVAKYSYGIYLTHMLAFWIAFVQVFPSNYSAAILLGVGLTAPMSYLAYHLVESPCIGIGSRFAKRFLDTKSLVPQTAPAGSDRLTAPLSS